MVLLAHDHPAVRAWVRAALVQAPDIEFAAEVSEGEEVWCLIQQICWDVALIACKLPGVLSGVDIAEREQEVRSGVHVLALGTPDHDGLLCRLWRAGVVGCIPAAASPEAILEAVMAAASGKLLWTPEQVTRVQRWWDEIGSRLGSLGGNGDIVDLKVSVLGQGGETAYFRVDAQENIVQVTEEEYRNLVKPVMEPIDTTDSDPGYAPTRAPLEN